METTLREFIDVIEDLTADTKIMKADNSHEFNYKTSETKIIKLVWYDHNDEVSKETEFESFDKINRFYLNKKVIKLVKLVKYDMFFHATNFDGVVSSPIIIEIEIDMS